MVDDEPCPQRKYLEAPPTRFLRKPYTVLVAAIALVAGMSLSAAAHETQAHPDDSQCESGEICLYDYNNQNGSGGIATYGGSDGDYGNDNYPYTSTDLDQSVNSYRNRGNNCAVYLRDLDDFEGWTYTVHLDEVMNLPSSYRNDTTSHHWCTTS